MPANKYDSVIKPNFDRIRELKLSGATDKDIYTTIGLSSAFWFKCKKEHKELRELLNNKGVIEENLDKAKEIMDKIPTSEMFLEKIANESYYNKNASMDVLLKAYRQIHKEENHYLQLEYEKLKIEREKIELEREKMELNKKNIDSQEKVGSDMIQMLSQAINPNRFRE